VSTPETLVVSFVAGLAVAVASAPVGVSGAVFLLPIQFSVLHVPSPAVTPTNLLFNIVATPGALTRYRRQASLRSPLTILLLAGTVPGMVIGAIVRVFLIPGPRLFRLVAAGLLLPLGIWLCLRNKPPPHNGSDHPHRPSTRAVGLLALGVGVVGGIYGVGGGSLLSPMLVGLGLPVSTVAPAALTSTFVTSLVGAITYTALATTNPGLDIAPDWAVGLIAGAGGLTGGYLGAALHPLLPERALRAALGVLAITTAIFYTAQAVT
jgi:uncharacterized membrane protein YfcA